MYLLVLISILLLAVSEKTTRIVICTVFIFEIKGPVVYLTLGTNTTERSQKSVKSLVLIYQQL